mgnify:CR=1 FL=1
MNERYAIQLIDSLSVVLAMAGAPGLASFREQACVVFINFTMDSSYASTRAVCFKKRAG